MPKLKDVFILAHFAHQEYVGPARKKGHTHNKNSLCFCWADRIHHSQKTKQWIFAKRGGVSRTHRQSLKVSENIYCAWFLLQHDARFLALKFRETGPSSDDSQSDLSVTPVFFFSTLGYGVLLFF